MSTEAVIGFVEHVAGSPDLEREFDAIVRSGGGSAKAMSEFGTKHGFEFSPEEFAQVTLAVEGASGGELNEVELGEVSGGTFMTTFTASTGTLLSSSSALKVGNIQQLP